MVPRQTDGRSIDGTMTDRDGRLPDVCTAYSWVSYYDAMVYRNSGAFNEPWFATLDASHLKEFGKWRYIRGFSKHDEMYYFDADGRFHER